tara:strand:- start:5049 stop:5459 length:411 start_codon:yes stop_codon:yes gene_type:complete
MKNNHPYIIEINSIGSSDLGYISVAEIDGNIPFEINRVYWTYYTPNNVQRGFHAHKELFQVIVAVSGVINFKLITQFGKETHYTLDDPSKGLFIPKMHWREISFSHNAVLLCLASEKYDESDYIRDFDSFLNNGGK